MSFEFSGLPCYDPQQLFLHCTEQRLPVDLWYGRANSYACPLGCAPGIGYVLLLGRDLASLRVGQAFDQLRTLTLNDPNSRASQRFPGMLFTGHAKSVLSGGGNDNLNLYLCEIADERWLYWQRGQLVDQNFNIVDDSSGNYVNSTTNSGTPWTWQQIVNQLWPSALGTAPTLPWTPDGTPNGFWYHNLAEFVALQDLLTRLASALRYEPAARTWTIVRLGASDNGAAEDIVDQYSQSQKNYDLYPLTSQTAAMPGTIRVNFKIMPPPTDGSTPYYSIDTAVSPSAGPLAAGSYVLLEDDLVAIDSSPGVYINAAALTSRAAERCADWLRKRLNFDLGDHQVYEGLLPIFEAVGSIMYVCAWRELGDGPQTELASGSLDNLNLQIERDARGGWIRTEYVALVAEACPLSSPSVVIGVSGFGLSESGNLISLDPADDAGAILYAARTFV